MVASLERPWARWGAALAALLLPLLVVCGVVLRVVQWAAGRSLWLDEVALALDLQTRSYGRLTGALPGDQAAPVGWLWLERWIFVHVGYGERTLRLVPLLFGCATLIVIALLARRVLRPPSALVAVALAAVSPSLVYYSDDLKQYSSDTFWVSLLALVTLRCSQRRTWTNLLCWGVLGATGLAFSHALLLALAGYGLVLLALTVRARSWSDLPPVAVAGVIVMAAAAVEYVVQLRALASTTALLNFWTTFGGFPPRPASAYGDARWLAHLSFALAAKPFGLQPPVLAVALAVLGACAIARRRPVAFCVLAAPVPVAIAVALLRRYPLADRLALFLVPAGLLLLTGVLDATWARRRPSFLALSALGLLIVGVPQAASAAHLLGSPLQVSETKSAFEVIAAEQRPGDGVFVYYSAGTSALYYAPKLRIGWDGTLYLGDKAAEGCRSHAATPRLLAHRRVWIVFGVRLTSAPRNEQAAALALVGGLGRLVESHSFPGAAVYLFEMDSARGHRRSSGGTSATSCLISERPPPAPALP